MEEKSKVAFLNLLFQSNEIHRLEVHLCDPQEMILGRVTLWNYQQGSLSFHLGHNLYYCTIYDQENKTQIVQLSISSSQVVMNKTIDFGAFVFKIRLLLEEQGSSHDIENTNEINEFQSIAREYYKGIKNKVILELERQNYIEKPKQQKIKGFLRKPKGKKNMTDLFSKNQKGEIKKIAVTSTSSIKTSKMKPVQQSIKIYQFPPIPVLTKMKTSVDDISKLSFDENSQPLTKIPRKQVKLISNHINNKDNSCLFKKQICRKSYRQLYVKTLQKQTIQDLDNQKQTISFLKSFNETDHNPSLKHKKSNKKKVIINSHGMKNIIAIYQLKKIRS